MASPNTLRGLRARRSYALPRSEREGGEVDDERFWREANCDLDILEDKLKEEENGQKPHHGVPWEGDDEDATSSPDSDEEPTDYFHKSKGRRLPKLDDDDSSTDGSLLDPGESDNAESDCGEVFLIEGAQWRRRWLLLDSRRQDRNRLYDLQKHEHEVGIERDALLAKLARIGGSASARAALPDHKLEARFAPWKTVDWTKPDTTGVQAAVDGSRLQPRAIERVLAFFSAHPHVKRDRCDAFCLGAYGTGGNAQSSRAHACLSEFQFANSYMVELVDTATGTNDDDGAARMTLFYFTFEAVDEAATRAAKAAYGDFVPTYTYAGSLALGCEQPELFVWRIECVRGRPFSAEAGRLTLPINGPRYEKVLRSYVDFAMAPMLRRGGVTGADAWPTAPHNLRCDGDNVIVRPGWSGFGGMVLWTAPAPVELPLGASLSGLLRLLGQPMRQKAVANPQNPWVPVDVLPFEGYRRDWDKFELLCPEYLQAQGAMPAVESDARSWQRMFAAMVEAVDLAADTADEDKPYYKREAEIMSGTWFHAKLGAYSVDAPKGEERERRRESEERLAGVRGTKRRR